MAKKRKQRPGFRNCEVPNCLVHKFWPTILPLLNGPMADAWVDPRTGELFIATGLKCLPDMELVPMRRALHMVGHLECSCGRVNEVRADLLDCGTIDRCWHCAAADAVTESN